MEYKPLDIVRLSGRDGEFKVYSSPMSVNGKLFFVSVDSDILTSESKEKVIEIISRKSDGLNNKK